MDLREENYKIFLADLLDEKRYVSSNPFELFIGLTNVCNLNCAFCPFCGFCMRKIEKLEMLPIKLIESMGDYFRTAKVLIPSGRGEPFLYKYFDEFIDICNQNDALSKMQLTNNGTRIGKYNLQKLKKVNIIGISFDAADERTFEILRYGAKFSIVLDNVKKLRRELPDNVLMFNVVVNRLNLSQMSSIFNIAIEEGVNYITYNGIYGNKEDKVIDLLRLRESDRVIVEQQMQEIKSLNKDEKIHVENMITFNGYDDGIIFDYEKIYEELNKLKNIEPYLNYDEVNEVNKESRRIKTEYRTFDYNKHRLKLPYCTSPWSVLDVQPNGDVCPCCASYGTIDSVKSKKLEEVWNGNNMQNLREAMFNYFMLPDICKECNSWMRYNHINEYIDKLIKNKKWDGDYSSFIIPPNYNPPEGFIKEKILLERIMMEREKNNEKILKIDLAELKINSEDYWDMRFEKDWNEFGGMQQTEFFAKLACDMLPEWFIRDIRSKQYTICDMGCALGNGVDVLSKFLSVEVSGIDFSEEAIQRAKEIFPQYKFSKGDLTDVLDNIHYDAVFCSNVLEHFYNPWSIFKNFAKISSHYIVLLVPFREKLEIHEHVFNFDTNLIPMEIEEFQLVYLDTINGADIEKTYYPDQQILLIYSKGNEDKKLAYLKDVTNGIVKSDLKEPLSKLLAYENEKTELLVELETQNDSIKKMNEQLDFNILNEKELQNQIEKYIQNEKELQKQITVYIDNEKELQKQIALYVDDKNELQKQITLYVDDKNELQKQISEFMQTQNELVELKKFSSERENVIQNALNQCNAMIHSRFFKLFHLLNRFIYQGIKGDSLERKQFRRWFFSRMHGSGDADRRYNPMFSVINILNSSNDFVNESKESDIQQPLLTQAQLHILEQKYTKYDVIILAVIDYDFRYQRPQHFATSFAENGHRVFYVNANYHHGSGVKKLAENLYVINFNNDATSAIYETDWSNKMEQLKGQLDKILYDYCIRDAITIVDYPNWVNAAVYLRERFGFKIVTDYMDDFTGFLNPAEELVRKNCISLLKESNMVIPSSQFLYDIAVKYNEHIGIVRNGTEFKHFNKVVNCKLSERNKVIGYYGAVAHWFDLEKVCYVAQYLPDCDVVIIGDVTVGIGQLKKYSNIKLLGEMPYAKLPEHLAYFDVCLIPFDTSTDLIKATNPVKFYEYLSAGKKIVATEIPELEPYKDKYVYMSNDNKQFLKYIELCLEGKDTLENFDQCVKFGQANDWQVRYEQFADLCTSSVPKVSIIVLTYNNFKLNKLCIDSILNETAYPKYELIIVDNQSTDGTREYLKELDAKNYSHIKVILNDMNSGFAGGNNIGIKKSDGHYILTLNNDTIVTRGWLTSLTKHLENDKKLGMCGPVTNSIGNEAKILAHYNDSNTLKRFAYHYTWEHMNEQFINPTVLALFCTMIKREVIEKCGLLDERYKVGMFEDDDYAEAVKRAGYKLAITEDSFIHHFDGATFKKLKDDKYRQIFEENKEKYENKWNIKWKMQKYRKGVDWNTNTNVSINIEK